MFTVNVEFSGMRARFSSSVLTRGLEVFVEFTSSVVSTSLTFCDFATSTGIVLPLPKVSNL